MQSFSGSFAGRFLEASWRRCHSSSGFCLYRTVCSGFFYVIPDRLDDDDEIRSLCGALVVVRLDTLFLFNSKRKHFLRCTYALI